jgi:predicted ATPase
MTNSAAEDGTPVFPVVPFISRVRLKNYKSIASCDVRLGPLTILVGPNGSGKSNFLDALAFLGRALATTPGQAIEERGGLLEILRRVPEQTGSFSIEVETAVARYGFEIAAFRGGSSFVVRREWEIVPGADAIYDEARNDRLVLPTSSDDQDVDLFNGLRRMQFYSFEPDVLRRPQKTAPGFPLGHAGEHFGDVLAALEADGRGYKARVDAYIQAVAPGVLAVDPRTIANYATVAIQTAQDAEFTPQSMSDGTIRAAAVLTALFQPSVLDGVVRLAGIEEPEIALHPAAAGVLLDALTEASLRVQVVATSQSADLLDREDLDVSAIRPVVMRDGLTIIGEVDDASREIVARRLYTLGELMRSNQLTPSTADGGT